MTLKYHAFQVAEFLKMSSTMYPVNFLRIPLLNEAWYHVYNVGLISIHNFYLILVHILNTQLHSIYLKQKNSVSQFFFDILIKFFFGCIIDVQKNFEKKRR